EAREDVSRSPGGQADNNAHRLLWIGLRPCDARDGRQRGSARGQMQKLPTVGEFHFEPPVPLHSITSSAGASSFSGMVKPGAPAIVKLMTKSNLVGCSIGRSDGFAPRMILST